MDSEIGQAALPEAPWDKPFFRRLPGTVAVGADDWIVVDDAYRAQMVLRERLLVERRSDVVIGEMGAKAACSEALDAVLALLSRRADFDVRAASVACPDGRRVGIDRAFPLATIGRLIQEDVCVLARGAEEHRVVAGVVAFPLGWRLSEKIGLPLSAVHAPVARYDPGLAGRVQRMLDGLRPRRPVMRANLFDGGPTELFAPSAPPGARTNASHVRSERQCLVKLDGGAVVFTIHTSIVARSGVPEVLRAAPQATARRLEGQ